MGFPQAAGQTVFVKEIGLEHWRGGRSMRRRPKADEGRIVLLPAGSFAVVVGARGWGRTGETKQGRYRTRR